MRLSRDPDSWKAGGVKRRDFRHTHDGPETPRHVGRRKNGKRWCRGKLGREHTPIHRVKQYGYAVDECSVCGRVIRYYWHPWS